MQSLPKNNRQREQNHQKGTSARSGVIAHQRRQRAILDTFPSGLLLHRQTESKSEVHAPIDLHFRERSSLHSHLKKEGNRSNQAHSQQGKAQRLRDPEFLH